MSFRKEKRETVTEEVLELNKLDADACKKFKGTFTDDGRCVVRLETDENHPFEAHLRKVNFKAAGRRRLEENE